MSVHDKSAGDSVRAWPSGALFATAFEKYFADFPTKGAGGLGIIKLDVDVWQAGNLSAVVADKMWMFAVVVFVGLAVFEAPDAISEIKSCEQAGFG